MGIRVRCGKCQKTFEAPDGFAGKRAKCRCGAVFVVPAPAAKPQSPAPLPGYSSGTLLNMLDEELTAGKAIAPVAVGPAAASQSVATLPAAPLAASPLAPVSAIKRPLFQRPTGPRRPWWECRIGLAALSMTTLSLIVLVMMWSIGGPSAWLLLPGSYLLLGMATATLCFLFPPLWLPGRHGPWVRPSAVAISILFGIPTAILILLPIPMVLMHKSGWKPPPEWAYGYIVFFGRGVPWLILGCIAIIILMIYLSIEHRLFRQRGLMGAAGVGYVTLPLVIFSVFVGGFLGIYAYLITSQLVGDGLSKLHLPSPAVVWCILIDREPDDFRSVSRPSAQPPSPSKVKLFGDPSDVQLPRADSDWAKQFPATRPPASSPSIIDREKMFPRSRIPNNIPSGPPRPSIPNIPRFPGHIPRGPGMPPGPGGNDWPRPPTPPSDMNGP